MILRQRNFPAEEVEDFMRAQESLSAKEQVGITILDMKRRQKDGDFSSSEASTKVVGDQQSKKLYGWG